MDKLEYCAVIEFFILEIQSKLIKVYGDSAPCGQLNLNVILSPSKMAHLKDRQNPQRGWKSS